MPPNVLYYGDNLDVLRRYVKEDSVDLIYLDPPFNSNATYNVLFSEQDGSRSAAQIKAFGDTWRWDQAAVAAYQDTLRMGGPVAEAIRAFNTLLGGSNMLAYIAMMAPRLVELRRVLKPTGNIFLHCDPTASHYLKLLMDAVFGPENFRNEIVWKRTSAHNSGRKFGPVHDIILFYSKSEHYLWHSLLRPLDSSYLDSHYKNIESGRRYKRQDLTGAGVRHGATGHPWRGIDPTAKGRHWMRPPKELDKWEAQGLIYWPNKEGAWPYLKLFLDERDGMPVQDVWDDIDPVNPVARERLGYPTQKPVTLLERIISSGSNPGASVLDPFCGCGTAIDAAQRLGRNWLGIDITHIAINLIKHRLQNRFGEDIAKIYSVIGEPVTLSEARALAEADPMQFQYWALGLVGARATEVKKGADKGIDGRLYFNDEGPSSKTKLIVLSVKAGHVEHSQVRDLRGVVEREQAAIGVFITLQYPSAPMRVEAGSAGVYRSELWDATYRRIQILTIEQLLSGYRIEAPPLGQTAQTFKKAPKGQPVVATQPSLFEDTA